MFTKAIDRSVLTTRPGNLGRHPLQATISAAALLLVSAAVAPPAKPADTKPGESR